MVFLKYIILAFLVYQTCFFTSVDGVISAFTCSGYPSWPVTKDDNAIVMKYFQNWIYSWQHDCSSGKKFLDVPAPDYGLGKFSHILLNISNIHNLQL